MVRYKVALIGACAAIALAAAPLHSASAHWGHRGGGPVLGLFALGAAAVVGAATIATAPFRALAAPGYYAPPPPAYYPPPQAYYPPAYYPPPAYSYGPPGYYGR